MVKKLTSDTDSNGSLTRLGFYTALGVTGSTFAATSAEADIVYTDLRGGNEIIINTFNSKRVGIDLDNNGTRDFQITFSSKINTFGTLSQRANLSAAAGAPGTNAFIGIDFYAHGVSVWAAPFGYEFSDAPPDYWFNAGLLASHYTNYRSGSTGGWFDYGVPKLALVRFEDLTGERRFGWVELINDSNLLNGVGSDDAFIVTRYAYARDSSIFAGQTPPRWPWPPVPENPDPGGPSPGLPEPSTLTSIGLLALGATGIRWRRREQSSET